MHFYNNLFRNSLQRNVCEKSWWKFLHNHKNLIKIYLWRNITKNDYKKYWTKSSVNGTASNQNLVFRDKRSNYKTARHSGQEI